MITLTDTARGPAAVIADFERRATRHETPCGDGTIVWRSWGGGTPVVLVHGAHGSWTHWIRNIDALAGDRQVWVPDLPGFGESAKAPEPEDGGSVVTMIAVGIRRLLGHSLPVDVVGFSLGGALAGRLAAEYPDLVRRLILVSAGSLGTPIGRIDTVSVRGLVGAAQQAAHRTNLLAMMIHDPHEVDDLALFVQTANVANARINPINLIWPDRLLQALPHVRAQIDAIWADQDRPHPEPALQRAVLSRFQPDVDFRVIANTGHWLMYEAAQAFNPIVRDMLTLPLRQRHTD